MAKLKKKGTSGQAKNFITRSAAVRKLQISLPDFRRLCIFKGIYPREPRNKKKAAKSSTPSTTFYYTKDIQYLLHEPLLAKFRDHKALSKKISRALGRGEVNDAARLERTQTPKIKLDHIIKERYPTFVDALRDLDDCLSTLFLFANLPSSTAVPPKTISLCQRLCLEFEHYLIVSHSLRRSFLSIKGIYYGAEIQGQDILWLVPYKFVQQITGDVDFRIMGTFVEFYTTLLGFVNYRLYTQIGLVYPPKFNAASDEQGGELGAFSLEGRAIDSGATLSSSTANGTLRQITSDPQATAKAQATADALLTGSSSAEQQPEEQDTETQPSSENQIDTFTSVDPTSDILAQPTHSFNVASTLFSDFTFFLSRETPRAPLEFILKAFGCQRVGWDEILGDGAYTKDELDSRITHQIVDKPPIPINSTLDPDNDAPQTSRGRVTGRTYIQPQWVWDCINAGKLLRPDLYAPGATLPPHLSPWMKPKAGEYDPSAPLEATEEDEAEPQKDESIVEGIESVKALGDLAATVDLEENEDDDDDEIDEDDVEGFGELDESDEENDINDNFAGFSDAEDETPAAQHQRELAAEAAGLPVPASNAPAKAQTARKAASRAQREKAEQLERQRMMMSKRKRKLFDKMQFSNARKDEGIEKLKAKRRRIEGAR